MQRASMEELLSASEAGAVVFDVRPPSVKGALSGSSPLSLEALGRGELPDLPKNTPVYLVCERGQVSELAGLYLEAAGFTKVYNLAGGLKAWRGS